MVWYTVKLQQVFNKVQLWVRFPGTLCITAFLGFLASPGVAKILGFFDDVVVVVLVKYVEKVELISIKTPFYI